MLASVIFDKRKDFRAVSIRFALILGDSLCLSKTRENCHARFHWLGLDSSLVNQAGLGGRKVRIKKFLVSSNWWHNLLRRESAHCIISWCN